MSTGSLCASLPTASTSLSSLHLSFGCWEPCVLSIHLEPTSHHGVSENLPPLGVSPRPTQAEQTNSRDSSSPVRTILTYNLHCFQYFLVELNYGSPSTVVFLDSFWWFGFLPFFFFCPLPPHLWSFQTIYPSISLPHKSCTQDLHLGKPSWDNYESFNYSERNGYSCC